MDDSNKYRDMEEVSTAHFILAPSHMFVSIVKIEIVIRMEELENEWV
jgi:hypothetical protein